MTGELIFKMELFKFKKDKGFLTIAAIIGVLNIVFTAFYIFLIRSVMYQDSFFWNMNDMTLAYFTSIGILLSVIVMIANVIFAMMLPFRMISMDYKNNVMALMVASGVNRSKLFFSKIGAVLLCTIGLGFAMVLIPTILVVIQIVDVGGLSTFLESINTVFRGIDISGVQVLFSWLLSYLSNLIMISAACILLKGSNMAFLLYIAIVFGTNIARGFLGFFPASMDLSMTAIEMFNSFWSVAMIAAFGFLSLYTMKHQNL